MACGIMYEIITRIKLDKKRKCVWLNFIFATTPIFTSRGILSLLYGFVLIKTQRAERVCQQQREFVFTALR